MKHLSIKKIIQLLVFTLILSLNTSAIVSYLPIVQAAENTSSVDINFTRVTITKNQKFKLKITGIKSKITWKSGNSALVSISKSGVITGKQNGSTVITATVAKKKYTCQVVVKVPYVTEPYEHWEHFSADYMSSDDLVQLDMKNTFDDFKNVGYQADGVYATVTSKQTIFMEGFDAKGVSLGIVSNVGLSYFEFKGAVKLRITNPYSTPYTIDFIPAKPLVIDKPGSYGYDDFTWYKLKDGNLQAPFVFAIKNSYMEYIAETEQETIGASVVIVQTSSTPHNTGNEFDPEMMDAWKNGHFTTKTVEGADSLTGLKISVNQYKVYFDELDIYVYGKQGLVFPENFRDIIFNYRDIVHIIGSKQYFPDQAIWDKILRLNYTFQYRYISAASQKQMYMSHYLLSEENTALYLHELTHYFHLRSQDYGCLISAWTEGTAQSLAEDGLKELGNDTSYYYDMNSQLGWISDEDLEDFENYFINVVNSDCYPVGYTFIRYIQQEYGSDVVYQINKNIQENIPKPSSDNLDANMRDSKSDKLFINAIKESTSKDVFDRYVEEIVLPILNITAR
jgi:hypothetical protein